MDATALLLSRLQFAFTISFHIIFPSFTIGLAAWLTILEALYLATGRPAYRMVFEFWLKIFGVAFGLGVVSGIVMAFQFGTNWEVLARDVGTNSRGAALLRNLHSLFPRGQFFWHSSLRTLSRSAVVLFVFDGDGGAGHHAFGVLDHGQQQLDAGARRLCDRERRIRPHRLAEIIFSPVLWVRFPHMLLASYLTGAFCVAATGAWYLLRGQIPCRSAHHAAHGSRTCGRARPGPALLRTLERRICGSHISRRRWLRSRRDGTTRSPL